MGNGDEPRSSEDLIREARLSYSESDDTVETPPVDEPEPEPEELGRVTVDDPPRPDPEPDIAMPWYQKRWIRTVAFMSVGIGFAVFQAIQEPERNAAGEITEAGVVGVFSVQVGDCLIAPDDSEASIAELDAVPCGKLHDLEAYARVTHPGESSADYPGNNVLITWGVDQCYQRFEGYVGAPWEEVLDLEIYIVTPEKEAWDDGERLVLCAATPFVAGERLSSSVRGVGPSADVIDLGMISKSDFDLGDCLGYAEPGEFGLFPARSCEGLHDHEVYAFLAHPAGLGSLYPSEDSLYAWGDQACLAELTAALEKPPAQQDKYTYFILWPSEQSWAEDNREFVCLTASLNGKATFGRFTEDL